MAESEAKKALAMKEKVNKMKKKANDAKLVAAEVHVEWAAEEERAEEEKGKMGTEAEIEMIDLCSPRDVDRKNWERSSE